MSEHLSAVPHLTTAAAGPLVAFEQAIIDHAHASEAWFREQWKLTPAPFYASVDLRHAGFKLAPVDTNLFPAGFNNLNPSFWPLCVQAVQTYFERFQNIPRCMLLIPENHTRNQFYMESLATLQKIIVQAGFDVRIGSLLPEITEPTLITLDSGTEILLEPLRREDDRVMVDDFAPCTVLLNNDLSTGLPAILKGISQPILPPPELGWSDRLKSTHFRFYAEVAREFAALVGIDPWLIDPMFRNCGEVDFARGETSPCLTRNIDALLTALGEKYQEYGIEDAPFAMVKADAGTYGMGVMTVHSSADVTELNRKQRNKMARTKEGVAIRNVIIQEGVYTHETWGDEGNVAEPVVYMLDHHVVGGFYRVHKDRGHNENLNSPGMRFEPLAFADCCIAPAIGEDAADTSAQHQNRFYVYGVVARLALLAAARELAAVKA